MILPRSLLSILVGVCTCLGSVSSVIAVVRYVNIGAKPGGDGLSWSTAYDSLSTALAAAEPGDQIWVATGRYVGNFTLALDVELYGGFAGTEIELSQRDWTVNPTILDGNQSGSVITSPSGATETTRIDGFTITGGTGSECSTGLTCGGGMYNETNSNPTVTNCTFSGNTAYLGGGMFNRYSSPTVTNCTFSGSTATESGGGMYNFRNSPTVTNCTFSGNTATASGGGIYNSRNSPTVTNCVFSWNTAGLGGGIYNDESRPTVTNCTFSGNSAANGPALACDSYQSAYPSTVHMYNCILWNGGTEIWNNDGSIITITHSDIQGGMGETWFGEGCIDADPAFVRNPNDGGDGWGDQPGTTEIDDGANDDFGDLRLQSGSLCINAGDPGFIPTPSQTDLDGHARVLCDRVDMGAYEFGIGDHDCDRFVDVIDFAAWDVCVTGPNNEPYRAGCEAFDFDADDDIDFSDFSGFQSTFPTP